MKQPQKQRVVLPKLPMLKPSQTNCTHFEKLGHDTICFHQTCRKTHTQVLCSQCDQDQQLHLSHTKELFAIHRSSPAFSLLSKTFSQSGEIILAAKIEACDQSIKDLQALSQSFIDQISSKYFKKLQCYCVFLRKEASFNVCSKIRNQSSQHQDCCIPIINKLKDLQDAGNVGEKSVEEIVLREAQRQQSYLQEQIDQFSLNLCELFNKLHQQIYSAKDDSENFQDSAALHSKRQETQQSIVDQSMQTAKIQEQYSPQDQSSNKAIEIPINQLQTEKSPRLKNQNQQIESEEKTTISLGKLQKLNNADGGLMSQNQLKAVKLSSMSVGNKNQFKCIKGMEMISHDVVRIWKKFKEQKIAKIINNLITLTEVRHIVIESRTFSSANRIKQILRNMNWIQGIHIHYSYNSHIHQENFAIKQISLLPTYRFLRLIDKSKYFNCSNTNMRKRKVLLKMKKLKQQPYCNKMYIYNNSCPDIPLAVEQLQFFSPDSRLIICKDIFHIPSTNRLQVLSFISINFAIKDVVFDKNVNFKHIFTECQQLNTLVFEDCQADYNKIIEQLKHLRVFQLKHLQVSSNWLDKNSSLSSNAMTNIFRLQSLQTLILTKISFVEESGRDKSHDSSIMKDINCLRELTYLNLYSSEPVLNDLLTYINKDCHKKMEMINIGCSEVTKGVGKLLQKFTNLKSLCVDYTSIDEDELLQATKDMKQLRYLSIENLNGMPVIYQQAENHQSGSTYGKITPFFFENLRNKHLHYLNIYNCDFLKEYKMESYTQLECVRLNSDLLSRSLLFLFNMRGIATVCNRVNFQQRNKLDSSRQEEKSIDLSKMPEKKQESHEIDAIEFEMSLNEPERKMCKQTSFLLK